MSEFSHTPQSAVDTWTGSFSGDDDETRDKMLEEIAATIDHCFNCADHDISVDAILMDAVLHAAGYIASQLCTCTWGQPCGRCLALGRYFDKRNER